MNLSDMYDRLTNWLAIEIAKIVCAIKDLTVDTSPLESILSEILEAVKNGDELLESVICDEDGNYAGSIIKVWNEDLNLWTEIYTDASGAISNTKPEGVVCSGKSDYEYKYIDFDKCLEDGTKIKEVYCEIFKDGESIDSTIFWIVNGVKVTANPGAVDCVECGVLQNSGLVTDIQDFK